MERESSISPDPPESAVEDSNAETLNDEMTSYGAAQSRTKRLRSRKRKPDENVVVTSKTSNRESDALVNETTEDDVVLVAESLESAVQHLYGVKDACSYMHSVTNQVSVDVINDYLAGKVAQRLVAKALNCANHGPQRYKLTKFLTKLQDGRVRWQPISDVSENAVKREDATHSTPQNDPTPKRRKVINKLKNVGSGSVTIISEEEIRFQPFLQTDQNPTTSVGSEQIEQTLDQVVDEAKQQPCTSKSKSPAVSKIKRQPKPEPDEQFSITLESGDEEVNVNSNVVIVAGSARTLRGSRFISRQMDDDPQKETEVKTQSWYLESRVEPNHFWKFIRATTRPYKADIHRLQLICQRCKVQREKLKSEGVPSGKHGNIVKLVMIQEVGCEYQVLPNQPPIEDQHHPDCRPKCFLDIAIDEAKIRIQNDVNTDRRVHYLSHKKHMRQVYERAIERGYTHRDVMARLPWVIGTYSTARRANQRAARLGIKQTKLDNFVDLPPEPPAYLMASLTTDGYLPNPKYNRHRENVQREAQVPYSLDDCLLDERLESDRLVRETTVQNESFVHGYQCAPLPGQYGRRLWRELGHEADKIAGDSVEALTDDRWLFTEGDDKFEVTRSAVILTKNEANVDMEQMCLSCTCADYMQKYLCICRHTRYVSKATAHIAQHSFSCRMICKENEHIHSHLVTLADERYRSALPDRQYKTFKPRPPKKRIVESMPTAASVAEQKILDNLPGEHVITRSEWNIITERSLDMANSDAVHRFPRDDDLFLVLVDRSAFTVQRRDYAEYDCNCDQMAALLFVCMHAAAVARKMLEFTVIDTVARRLMVDDYDEEEEHLLAEAEVNETSQVEALAHEAVYIEDIQSEAFITDGDDDSQADEYWAA